MKKIAVAIRYSALEAHGFINRRYYVAKEVYDIFEKLNWLPIPVFSNTDFNEIADMCDALLVPGSYTDIDPVHYGQPLDPKTVLSEEFDVFASDKKIIDAFLARNKRIVGICAGCQSLNVYFGGDMYQHVPDHSLQAGQKHVVHIKPGTRLHEIYGTTELSVNSYHHQAIRKVASSLTAGAYSDDGIIEEIEAGNILAVQWHPEMDDDILFFQKAFE